MDLFLLGIFSIVLTSSIALPIENDESISSKIKYKLVKSHVGEWDDVPTGDLAVCPFVGGSCVLNCGLGRWPLPFTCEHGSCCVDAKAKTWEDEGVCGFSQYINSAGIEFLSARLGHTPFIVGGQEARPGEFPWQVAIFEDGVLDCGGVVIDNQWVLTAAHCVNEQNSEYILALGEHDTLTYSGEEQYVTVSQADIFLHPRYDQSTNSNDIALMRMGSLVTFNENIVPACRPNSVLNDDETLLKYAGTVSGWGITGYNQPRSTVLRYVNVPLIGHQQCADLYSSIGTVSSNQICAGDVENGGRDACAGDSGGPLVVKHEGRFNLIGIVSWGNGCGEAGYPGIYTRVSNHVAWIDAIIENHSITRTLRRGDKPG